VLPETLQLEQLRQQVEAAEHEIGNQSDYLGYGKPNAQQAKQAHELMARMKEQSQMSQAELQQLIATLRAERPEAFEGWIDLHLGMLEKIIAAPVTDINSRARQNVARETAQAWDRVRSGEQVYVNINWHFLKDYKAELQKLTGATGDKKADVPSEGKDAKPWWKIW
jgi:hypothetical protein